MAMACLVAWGGIAAAEPTVELSLWSHPYLQPMARDLTPPKSAGTTLRFRTTPGEYEPAVLAVRASAETMAEMTVQAEPAANAMPRLWITINRVESLNAKTSPKRLMGGGRTQPLPANQTVFFWLTVRPPVTAAPGIYRATIALDAAGKRYTAELVCEVLPFILVDSPIVGGAFMGSSDLPRRWYQDMKAHGINAIQMFWGSTGMGVRNNPTEPIRSVAWEAIREGQDDLRYVATAERLISLATPEVRKKASEKLQAIRLSLDPSRRQRAPRAEEHDEVSLVTHVNEPQRVRDAIIDLILELSHRPGQ